MDISNCCPWISFASSSVIYWPIKLPLLSLFSLLLSLPCFASLLSPFLLQEILTIAVHSVSPLAGQAWLRLNAWLHWEFFSHQQTKDAVSHLKVSATYTANRRSKISIQLSLELSLKLAHTEDCLTTAAVNEGGLSAVSRSSFQSAACNSPKGRRTSSFEGVTVKDLKSGSRQVMRWTQPDFVAQDQLGSPADAAVWGPLLILDVDNLLTATEPWKMPKIPLSQFKLFLNNPCVFFSYWKRLLWNNKCQIPPRNWLECRDWWSQILVMFWDSTVETAGVPWEGDHFRNITIWPAWSCALLTLFCMYKRITRLVAQSISAI